MNTNEMLQHLFDEHRSKLQTELDGLSLYDETKDMLKSIELINEYLHGMQALLMTRSNLGIENSMYIPEQQQKPRIEKTYTFERKLRGGIIRVNNEDYYIPEQMVNDMKIDHGDEVRILDKTYLPDGKTRYSLDVVERYFTPHPQRRMFTGCTHLDETNTLRVLDPETMLDVRIMEKDKTRFQLKENETVTLAYYLNNNEVSAVFSKESSADLFRLLYVMPEGTHYMERCENIPPYFEKATRYHGTENTMTKSYLTRQHNILIVFGKEDSPWISSEIEELIAQFAEEGKPSFIMPLGSFPEPTEMQFELKRLTGQGTSV